MSDNPVKAGSPNQEKYIPTQADKDNVMAAANYLDQGQGFGLDKLRPLFPKAGWNVIIAVADSLVADGKLKTAKEPLPANPKVKIQIYRKA